MQRHPGRVPLERDDHDIEESRHPRSGLPIHRRIPVRFDEARIRSARSGFRSGEQNFSVFPRFQEIQIPCGPAGDRGYRDIRKCASEGANSACATANAALTVIESEGLIGNAATCGTLLAQELILCPSGIDATTDSVLVAPPLTGSPDLIGEPAERLDRTMAAVAG